MKTNKSIFLIFIAFLFIAGCKKEDNTTDPIPKDVIVYSADHEIYKMYSDTVMRIQLTNDGHAKTEVALRHDKNRIAYLDEDDDIPIIIDMDGNVIQILSNYKGAKCLRWSKSDTTTLYFIYNNEVTFYGNELTIPYTTPVISGIFESIDISTNNDLAFVINSGGYSYLGCILNDESKTTLSTYSDDSYFENVKWSNDNASLYYCYNYDDYYSHYEEIRKSSIYNLSSGSQITPNNSTSQYAFSENEDFILYCYNYSSNINQLQMEHVYYSYDYQEIIDGYDNNIKYTIYLDM